MSAYIDKINQIAESARRSKETESELEPFSVWKYAFKLECDHPDDRFDGIFKAAFNEYKLQRDHNNLWSEKSESLDPDSIWGIAARLESPLKLEEEGYPGIFKEALKRYKRDNPKDPRIKPPVPPKNAF